jgi:hypothetical protein
MVDSSHAQYATVRSGDIILFSGWSIPAAAVRIGTYSEWTHSAVAVWLSTDEGRRLFFFEAARVADEPCALRDGRLGAGCRLVQADQVAYLYSKIAVRHVAVPTRGAQLREKLRSFLRENEGKAFPSGLTRVFLVNAGLAKRRAKDDGTILCSELCSTWLEWSGVLSPDFVRAHPHHLTTPAALAGDTYFPPGTFSGPMELLKDDGMDGAVRTGFAAVWLCSLFLYILLSVEDDKAYYAGERRGGTKAIARWRARHL